MTNNTVSTDGEVYEPVRGGAARGMIATRVYDDAADGVGGDQASDRGTTGPGPVRQTRSPVWGSADGGQGPTPAPSQVQERASAPESDAHERGTAPAASPALSGWDSDEDPISIRSASPPQSIPSSRTCASERSESTHSAMSGHRGPQRSKKNTKASVRVATENVRGRGAQNVRASTKWKQIAEDMRRDRIGLMAVQETHLSADHVEEIEEQYRHLRVINSAQPDNPTGAGGVAIVLNKLLTNTERIRRFALVPGRALMVNFEWHRGKELTVLAVYAPTDKDQNSDLWETLEETLCSSRIEYPSPDIMLGDFNFVEDSVDRYPARLTRMDNPDSFKSLKAALKLRDGWRYLYPSTTEWTWRDAQRGHMSRLDRVYMTKELARSSVDWRSEASGITRNDHDRVATTIFSLDGPDVGRGRWSMRDTLSRDDTFLRTVGDAVKAAEARMSELQGSDQRGTSSCQKIWQELKSEVGKLARARTREINCKRQRRLAALTRERASITAQIVSQAGRDDADLDRARESLRETENKIFDEKSKAHGRAFAMRATRAWAEGETMSKSWFRWPTTRRKCETIPFLKKEVDGSAVILESSTAMAEAARDYHESIQSRDLDTNADAREAAILEALDSVKVRVSRDDWTRLAAPVGREDVAEAIRQAKNGKAAGTDGLIHELWKELDKRCRGNTVGGYQWPDIAAVMARVFRDVEENGVEAGSGFTEGWMCPLFKKGERSDIANYRPITLLNTDYKLFTKVLASKLAIAAQYLVHSSQAGFVRGRSITDQIKVTLLMMDYAEANEEDGAIIALDQEKAYDRVRHDYLIRILMNLGLPDRFVRTVESLYSEAFTSVMVNGHLSKPYRVTRGVRQGDPLSCLLFNLAIEPLSALMRASELRGYRIPGVAEKLIASLYADDTTVYMSKFDKYDELQAILDLWCCASGAKFNTKKTEVIPIGSLAHRTQLIESRRIARDDGPLPDGIRVARDGEVTRILGAWPGNAVKNAAIWSTIESKILDRLDAWERTKPTLAGRAIITQVVVGGCTQYLTAAQGMPQAVARSLDGIALKFVWQHAKRHPVNMETLRLPRKEGGLNLVHVQARNDAQYLTWVSAFLAPAEKRPTWAFLADGIFAAKTIEEHRRRVPPEQWGNPFSQEWRANTRALPYVLQQMVRVAKKYQLVADDPLVPMAVREGAKVWTHPAMLNTDFLHHERKRLRCLRTKHEVKTVEDLEEIAELDDPGHTGRKNCGCDNCLEDRAAGCTNPSRCQEAAADVLGLISERWNTATAEERVSDDLWDELEDSRPDALEQGEALVFDHRPPRASRMEDLCRIFVDTMALKRTQAGELIRSRAGRRGEAGDSGDSVTAAACAGLAKDERGKLRGGFAVHYPAFEVPDVMHSCGSEDPTYDRCAALAVVAACVSAPRRSTLHILMTSKMVTKALTTGLEENERTGWSQMPASGQALRMAAAALRSRAAETTLTYISRARVKQWPEVSTARTMAQVAAVCCGEMPSQLRKLRAFDRPGRSILGLTQRQAHRAIRERAGQRASGRTVTAKNMATVRAAIEEENGYAPSETRVWTDLQDRSLSRQVRNFLWKGMHGAHKVGEYFQKMPEPWRSMANCPTCGTVESMEHILFECQDSGQDMVWRIVQWFLRRKGMEVEISAGLVWGCASYAGSQLPGANRAFRIVVSEAAFMIWKMRCEKRIEHGEDDRWRLSRSTIAARWKAAMKTRRAHDVRMAKPRLFGNRAIDIWEVSATWRDTLNLTFFDLYRNRTRPGVLVGPGGHNADGIG